MKNKVPFIFSLLFIFFSLYDTNAIADSKTTRIRIEISQNPQSLKPIRRDAFVSVSAWYDAEADVVELECYDIKNADVYIVNTYGDIVSSGSFDSTFNSYYVLDVPEQAGIYWLVIDSPVLYGEGMFEVK